LNELFYNHGQKSHHHSLGYWFSNLKFIRTTWRTHWTIDFWDLPQIFNTVGQSRTCKFAVIESSQLVLILLVQGLYFENHCFGSSLKTELSSIPLGIWYYFWFANLGSMSENRFRIFYLASYSKVREPRWVFYHFLSLPIPIIHTKSGDILTLWPNPSRQGSGIYSSPDFCVLINAYRSFFWKNWRNICWKCLQQHPPWDLVSPRVKWALGLWKAWIWKLGNRLWLSIMITNIILLLLRS
jgi:hypothetical protein